MKPLLARYPPAQLYILLGFIVVFSGFTGWLLWHQSPSDWRDNHNWTAILLAVSGPFTGALARPTESDCWRMALKLFWFCLPGVLLAIVVPWLPWRRCSETGSGIRRLGSSVGAFGFWAAEFLCSMLWIKSAAEAWWNPAGTI